MHASQEDLEIFRDMFGIIPKNIFDCQLANAFLDGDFSISYSGLVSKRTGVTLEKSETRSDWLGRPLTVNQEKYAAEDVFYLLDLFSSLKEDLRVSNKLGWFVEEYRVSLFAPELKTPVPVSPRRLEKFTRRHFPHQPLIFTAGPY